MTLETLKKQRSSVKKNISRIKNIVESSAKMEEKALCAAELKCRLGILESYFKQALTIQSNIEELDEADNCRGELEDIYITARLSIQSQLGEDALNSTMSTSACPMPVLNSKLPTLKLPTFSGKYSEYKNFIVSFNQIIDRELNLTNLEKFNHLINCLHGQALETVRAFQVTHENYPKALARLKVRYDNSTLIFLENISALFDLPAMSKSSSTQLRSLVDNASALYGSLLSLGSEAQVAQAMLIHIVMQKCDEESNRKWKESLDFETLPNWDACTTVIDRHCQYLESLDGTQSNVAETQQTNKSSKGKKPKGYSFSLTKSSCHLCTSPNHKIFACDRFKSMDAARRFETVKRLSLCINCLSKGHQQSSCPSHFRCKLCSQHHNSMLHSNNTHNSDAIPSTSRTAQQVSSAVDSRDFPSNSKDAVTHTHMENSSMDRVILATAMVMVRDASGQYKLGRALLDSCSQVNFITDEFSQKLKLPRAKNNIEIQSIGNTSTNIKYKTSATIQSKFTGLELPLTFCITSHIAYQPDTKIDVTSWNIPSNIELADEKFYNSSRVDLLLGTESFFSILSVGQIRLGDNLPILQKTLLGWVVSGRYQGITSKQTCMLACNDSLDEKLEHLWKLEEVSIAADVWTREQHSCEHLYTSAVSRNPEGRVIVRLPFKDDPACLGSSYTTALRRFVSQEHRLSRSPELKAQYVDFMKEYEQLGHMSVVENPNFNEPHYYIPHHCVFKPTSTSTRLRVVFDASCRTTSQRSLNDIQFVGPTLQSELVMLLLRFRLFRFAITADIVKMFRQILVHHNDRKFQYVLWRSSPNEDVRTFQLNTVTYGMAASPYLAVRSLFYIADQYASRFKVGASVVKSSFYVDDLLGGADSATELARIRYEVEELLKFGHFELAKWHSNHHEFRDNKTIKNLDIGDSVTSALGLKWDQNRDCFLFSFKKKPNSATRVTKRSILSIASSLFDPLGLLAPVLITAKILLQELWLLKLDWDESVPQNLHLAWENLLTSLSHLSTIVIPRYCLAPEVKSIQLHGFCDASIRAYGCGIYVRVLDKSGNIQVYLLTAKSRVAPTKKQTLPKLELCGAWLLARLYDKIKVIFSNYNTNTFLWTDSQIVLHWLKLHSVTLSTFVGNRVSEIQSLTIGTHWRYVPTRCNPADVVSRGCTVEELGTSIWLTGPSFLYADMTSWPVNKSNSVNWEEVDKEKRKSAFQVTVSSNYILDVVNKISSHLRSLRVIAYLFRFYQKFFKTFESKFETVSPSPQELRNALDCIVWNIQQHYFADDIRSLKKNLPTSSAVKFLNPFLDDTGRFTLLKVGGRLELANLPESRKHPVLLPSKCDFVFRFVQHLHTKNYHAGPKALIALIRLEFWIVNARDIARRVVRSCIHCVRYKPRLLQQIMGHLPVERLTPSRPFARCGVDFAGPVNIYIRIRGKAPYKAYIAMFICLATKAVHIELVSDLSTDAFLSSLKRMIGRRGLPTDIFCDNATNFVGACNKLAELKAFLFNKSNQNSIINYCNSEFIKFHFIPPRAPHFGGIWEAAVKSAKGHLNRSLTNARLTFEELSTVLVEIEAILNSRPITPLSSDPSDYDALTPGHFLIGSSLKTLPERDIPAGIDHLEKWERVSGIKQQFWKRWVHDYVNELQVRTKWVEDHANVTNDAMVIIHEDNVPPIHWQLGRIVNCIPGRDERVRVVDVRTAKGVIRRPIRKLALLPV